MSTDFADLLNLRLARAAAASQIAPLTLSSDAVTGLAGHYALMTKWNRTQNLTRVTALEAAMDIHYVDSLLGLHLAEIGSWPDATDIGSGPGFPGLVAAIAYPGLRVVLVEKSAKKCSFLQEAVRTLNLENVMIERRVLKRTDAVERAISRATLSLDNPVFETVAQCPHVVLWVGAEPTAESWEVMRAQTKQRGRRLDYVLADGSPRGLLIGEPSA